jgi:spore coat protein H
MLVKNSIVYLVAGLLLVISCKESPTETVESADEDIEISDLDISDWSESTHSNDANPDYDIVFPQENVNRIDLEISEEDWQSMLEDMIGNYGTFGSNTGGGPPTMGGSDDNPIYVPCSLFFNGVEWYKVGVRFKGNSSLRTSWEKGIWKIPLRLNFDRYEDEFSHIDNQRFYGFKELSLSSNYDDKSLIREKITPEIFRDFGVAAPQTAFYRVYINTGDESKYFGLYTMVEIIEDTMLDDQFNDDDGNAYKPEGNGASFAENSFSSANFEKKTNETSDWSDIEALFDVLHSYTRITDKENWRTSLEQVFNVDNFIKWLAVNTTIQNWDTYGRMTHNYYLYNNPKDNQLTWIPWDNNEALQTGKQGEAVSISCDEVSNNWPLIRYLLDDEVYLENYKVYLKQTVETAFEPSKMITKYQYYQNLISEYVVGINGEQENYTFLNSSSDFDSAINYLVSHANSRYDVVQNYVN